MSKKKPPRNFWFYVWIVGCSIAILFVMHKLNERFEEQKVFYEYEGVPFPPSTKVPHREE